MAQPTTNHPAPMAPQPPTAGVGTTPGSMKPAPTQGPGQKPDTEGAKPVLFEDLDPILLARLYPEALTKGLGDARGLAEKAGAEAHKAGQTLFAAAQEGAPGYPAANAPGSPQVAGPHTPPPPAQHGPPAPPQHPQTPR